LVSMGRLKVRGMEPGSGIPLRFAQAGCAAVIVDDSDPLDKNTGPGQNTTTSLSVEGEIEGD